MLGGTRPSIWEAERRERSQIRTTISCPYHYSEEKEPSPSHVKVGIVGTGATITVAKQVLKRLGEPVESPEANKWLYPDFPGFSLQTTIKSEFQTSVNWEVTLKENEIEQVLLITDDANKRIAAAANLYKEKVRVISLEDNKPDVILCTLPLKIEEHCGTGKGTRLRRLKLSPEAKLRAELKEKGQSFLEQWGLEIGAEEEPKVPESSRDLHNSLKGKVMDFGIPIQILRESSAQGFLRYGQPSVKVTQEPASVAWNLSTAMYYKANGKPWRLAKLRQDTCYVGISFFHNVLNSNLDIETSMAQVFTHNGEGIVLRGTEVFVDRITRQPHMSERQSYELISEALKTYEEKAGRSPTRITIHKTSSFYTEERNGIDRAIRSLSRDLVTINPRHSYRFVRDGNYPVLRGTMISLTDHQCLLYTTGYIPRIRTYPGHRIPEPLMVTHRGDSEMREVCKEIMGLTKLNWNTAAFATYLPITLEFSQRVGKILSELPEGRPLQNHYRFYM